MVQAHLHIKHRQFPFRYIEDLPAKYARHICKCDEFGYKFSKGIRNFPAVTASEWPLRCSECGKYNAYLLFVCVDCDEPFLKNFQHPRFCHHEHFRCWDCLNSFVENDETGMCCDRVTWWMDKTKVMEPVDLRIREYTAEELAEVVEPFTIL